MSCILAFRFFFAHTPDSYMSNEALDFSKRYKLASAQRIEEVYTTGLRSFVYPFKVYHLRSETDSDSVPFRICVTAPKRRFKKAVDRNTIKRRSREAVRLNKYLIDHQDVAQCIDIYLVYVGQEIESYATIEKSVVKILSTLSKLAD